MFKKCPICKKVKSLDEFYNNRSKKDGKQYRCKECCKNKYYDDHESKLNYAKQYRENNADIIAANRKQYYRENRQDILTQKKQYYIDNKERINVYKKEYVLLNKDKIADYQKTYRKKNKEYLRLQRKNKHRRYTLAGIWKINFNKRRARKQALPDTFTKQEWFRCLDYFDNRCCYCGKYSEALQMDHFIPLSKDTYLGTVKENIVPACASCNFSKHDSMPLDWLMSKYSAFETQLILGRIQSYFRLVLNAS